MIAPRPGRGCPLGAAAAALAWGGLGVAALAATRFEEQRAPARLVVEGYPAGVHCVVSETPGGGLPMTAIGI